MTAEAAPFSPLLPLFARPGSAGDAAAATEGDTADGGEQQRARGGPRPTGLPPLFLPCLRRSPSPRGTPRKRQSTKSGRFSAVGTRRFFPPALLHRGYATCTVCEFLPSAAAHGGFSASNGSPSPLSPLSQPLSRPRETSHKRPSTKSGRVFAVGTLKPLCSSPTWVRTRGGHASDTHARKSLSKCDLSPLDHQPLRENRGLLQRASLASLSPVRRRLGSTLRRTPEKWQSPKAAQFSTVGTF